MNKSQLKKTKDSFLDFNFFVLLIYQLSFIIFKDNFKIMVAITFILLLFFVIKKVDLFSSSSMLFLSSILFYSPLRKYEVLLVYPENFFFEPFKLGLIGIYGMNLSDILAFILLFCLIFYHKNLDLKSKNVMTLTTIIVLYIGFGMFSAISNSLFPTYSLITHFQTIKTAFVLIITYILIRDKSREKYFISSLFSVFSFHGIMGFLDIFTPNEILQSLISPEENLLFPRIHGTIGHPVVHTFILSLLALIILYYLISRKKKLIYFVPFTLLYSVNLIFSQSRSAWILCLIFLFIFRIEVYSFIKKVFQPKPRFLFLALLPILIITPIFLDRSLKSLYFFTPNEGGLSLRISMISQGLKLFRIEPLFGHGTNTVVPAFFTFLPESYVQYYPLPVHYLPLFIALESGIVGLLLITAFFASFVYFFIYSLRYVPVTIKKILYTFIALLVVHYLFHPIDGYRRDPYIIVMFVGWYIAIGEQYASKIHINKV
jgi:hypothetical protein